MSRGISWYRATPTISDVRQQDTDGRKGEFLINALLIACLTRLCLQLENLDAASEILILTYTMNSLFWGKQNWSYLLVVCTCSLVPSLFIACGKRVW